jgi:hypothetical protein
VILVGIAGGIPREKSRPDPNDNVNVGYVVVGWPGDVGSSHVNWSKGRYKTDGFQLVGQSGNPSRRLIVALDLLRMNLELGTESFHTHLDRLQTYPKFDHPGMSNDRLFKATYDHIGTYADCSACKNEHLVERQPRKEGSERELFFHERTIASGDGVVMDAELRDEIRRHYEGAICIETEAFGASIASE